MEIEFPVKRWSHLHEILYRLILSEKLRMLGGLFKDYASTLRVRAFRKHLVIYLFSFTAKYVYNTGFVE
ncbi:hypothetical protein [Symbiopectobacterium purcellii]|uniref:hypothetical protein n=1 Tax=Symbiopectobacterium purcellii TaxID=2871826 RepID=UPI003F8327EB